MGTAIGIGLVVFSAIPKGLAAVELPAFVVAWPLLDNFATSSHLEFHQCHSTTSKFARLSNLRLNFLHALWRRLVQLLNA